MLVTNTTSIKIVVACYGFIAILFLTSIFVSNLNEYQVSNFNQVRTLLDSRCSTLLGVLIGVLFYDVYRKYRDEKEEHFFSLSSREVINFYGFDIMSVLINVLYIVALAIYVLTMFVMDEAAIILMILCLSCLLYMGLLALLLIIFIKCNAERKLKKAVLKYIHVDQNKKMVINIRDAKESLEALIYKFKRETINSKYFNSINMVGVIRIDEIEKGKNFKSRKYSNVVLLNFPLFVVTVCIMLGIIVFKKNSLSSLLVQQILLLMIIAIIAGHCYVFFFYKKFYHILFNQNNIYTKTNGKVNVEGALLGFRIKKLITYLRGIRNIVHYSTLSDEEFLEIIKEQMDYENNEDDLNNNALISLVYSMGKQTKEEKVNSCSIEFNIEKKQISDNISKVDICRQIFIAINNKYELKIRPYKFDDCLGLLDVKE